MWLGTYDHNIEFNLAASEGSRWTLNQILSLGSEEERQRFLNHKLAYSRPAGAEGLRAAIADMQGVVRVAQLEEGSIGTFRTVHRGKVGDARGSSENNLCCEFLGDYNYVAASRTFGAAVWNDVRNAGVCKAINDFRQSLMTSTPLPKPAPLQVCPANFGNTDIYGGSYSPGD